MTKVPSQQGMVITRTPFRVSLFGGGTDFPGWFNDHQGLVVGGAINKYLYVTINSLERYLEKRIRLSYSKLEQVNTPHELEHDIARCILSEHMPLAGDEFLDVHSYADLPAATGMGSSSAFTVGMLNAMHLLKHRYVGPNSLAQEAITVERDKLGEAGGWQDQVFAAHGGFNAVRFNTDGFHVEPLCLAPDMQHALDASTLLFFTGTTRRSCQVHERQAGEANNPQRRTAALQSLAEDALKVLRSAPTPEALIEAWGGLLHDSWCLKRAGGGAVSNPDIDAMYDAARGAGAFGGKLCGAGGGGFLLCLVPSRRRRAVLEALSTYRAMTVRWGVPGSQAIYYQACQPWFEPVHEVAPKHVIFTT